jgi:hypothetical protein
MSDRDDPRRGDPHARADWREAAHWAARARWISHACDFLGDPVDELSPRPGNGIPGRPEFLVLVFAPRPDRPYFSYLTAGLGLVAQAPGGPTPHLELIACAETLDLRIAQLLFMLSHDIASAEPGEAAYKPFDLWGAECFGLRDFVLAPAREPEALLDFPNLEKRKEDERYLLAATGALTGRMHLTLAQLVPLTPAQWERASAEGSRAFLDAIGWTRLPKTEGWSALARTVT